MVDVILVFTIGTLLALTAGGGWAALLAFATNSWTSWAFWSFVVGIAIESLAWSWAFGTGGGLWPATGLAAAAAVVGWTTALRAGTWSKLRCAAIGLDRLDIATLTLIAAIMVIPGLNGINAATLAYRIGPDGVGNAVAAEALAAGNSISAIETEVVEATGASSIDTAMDQDSHLLYTPASLRTQVRAEFLVAGLRWGYSGAAALPLQILGRNHLWAVVTLLPVLAALFAALGIISNLAEAGLAAWMRAGAVILAVVGVTLLNAFREGGMAQMWVVPCTVAFAWAVLDEKSDLKTRAWMGAIASAGLLPAYSDATFLLAVVLALSIIIALMLRDRQRALEHCWVAVGALAGIVATGPYFLRFITYVPKRLKDSKAGGWLLPRWTSPSETIGLFNSYNLYPSGGEYLVDTVPRSGALEVAVAISDIVLIGLTISAMVLTLRYRATALLIAATFTIAVFYVKARGLDHATNYQYFKAAGIAQPLLGLTLVLVWQRAALMNRRMLRWSLTGLTTYAGAACMLASTAYTFSFMKQDSLVDGRLLEAIRQPAIGDLVENHNVVSPSGTFEFLQTATLIPLRDVHWFGRSAFGMPQRWDGREANPLSLVVLQKDCENWTCVRGVRAEALHEIGPTLRMVDLAPDSREIATVDDAPLTAFSVTISALSRRVGGPLIGVDLRPVS